MKVSIELQDCKLLGSGAEGNVYISPEGYALKIFNSKRAADEEAFILNKVKESRFFPTVLVQVSNLVVREYVGGVNLYEYLDLNGLSKQIAFEIIEFVEELKFYNFKRINIRNAHIFISKEEKLMVIDPRKAFVKITPYPKDIIKILLKLHLFDKFLSYVTEYDHELLSFWIKGYEFVSETNKVSRYG